MLEVPTLCGVLWWRQPPPNDFRVFQTGGGGLGSMAVLLAPQVVLSVRNAAT